MSVFVSPKGAAAGLTFFILYTFYCIAAFNVVRKEGWKTIYTYLVMYGVIRFAGQLCGVVFSRLGIDHYQWLIAYLVLGAEGYFVLVLFGMNLIIQAQREIVGWSWLKPTKEQRKTKTVTGWFKKLSMKFPFKSVFHLILIPANVLIIYGGSSTAGKTSEDLINDSSLTTSRALRATGQAVFLTLTIVVIVLAIYLYWKEGIKHLKLYSVLMAAPFITVRGIFGVLSIYISNMDYYNFQNYNDKGLKSLFITYEYVLGTTMEFITASIYMASYYYLKYNQPQTLSDNEKLEDKHEIDSVNDI